MALAGVHTAQAAPGPKNAAVTCTNLLINSDMESDAGWTFGATPAQARYVTDRYYSPFRSVLLGITNGPNVHSYSSMQQSVNAPAGSILRIGAHVYPLSHPYDDNDVMELVIMDKQGRPLRRVWNSISNARAWHTLEFDISEFAGRQFIVYFNVLNDGRKGVSAMYIDDVTLELCQGDSFTPTPTDTPAPAPTATPQATIIAATDTPAPTPTSLVPTSTPPPNEAPTPSADSICQETLINGDFENDDGWTFGNDKLLGRYTNAIVHSHQRAVQLGDAGNSPSHKRSYSSISQPAYLSPSGNNLAILSFWYYPISDMEPGDYQEALLLDGRTRRRIKTFRWRVQENSQQWLHKSLDVTPYLGRGVIVYFDVYNDGGAGRAAMYIDEVSLQVCGPAQPAPTPTQQGLSAPTPTPMPTPTSSPPPTATPLPTALPATPTLAPLATATAPSPDVSILPALSPSPVAQQAWPAVGVPLPTPAAQDEKQTFGQIALNGLWYFIIAIIAILIIVIAITLLRLLWGKMDENRNSS